MDAQPLTNEKQILQLVADGDQASFSTLLDHHWDAVYVFALLYLKSAENAEELTQDVFVAIWKEREKLAALDSFQNYLFIVARNKTYSLLRKRIRAISESGLDLLEEKMYIPDMQLMQKELYEQLMHAIDQLPPKRKTVFTMSRLQGCSHGEIAARLEISKQTVNEHIMEATVFLKTFLKNHPKLYLLVLAITGS